VRKVQASIGKKPKPPEKSLNIFIYILDFGMFWEIGSVHESPGNLTSRSLKKTILHGKMVSFVEWPVYLPYSLLEFWCHL
jgi:hypothetical protein